MQNDPAADALLQTSLPMASAVDWNRQMPAQYMEATAVPVGQVVRYPVQAKAAVPVGQPLQAPPQAFADPWPMPQPQQQQIRYAQPAEQQQQVRYAQPVATQQQQFRYVQPAEQQQQVRYAQPQMQPPQLVARSSPLMAYAAAQQFPGERPPFHCIFTQFTWP